MKFLRRNQAVDATRVSFVLLDWSCCESLHTLDYLADQDIDRDCYEVLWIEFFAQQHEELRHRCDVAETANLHAPVDTWIVMEMPVDVCHHKHLMYNVGILASRGELICFCDSDAMMRPGFVRSILDAFDADADIVLHHDEVRNHSQRFYPFRYPGFEDVCGPGCNNWVNGRTLGLWDEDDPLHSRNYGASMTARREDLVAIGGADLHTDYLGHVCGPYEMTFRLVNHGLREVWCDTEFLYHTWHPRQAGSVDHCGPHDGHYMSTTALAIRETGRIQPLTRHPAIETTGSHALMCERIEAGSDFTILPEWERAWRAKASTATPRNDKPEVTTRAPVFREQLSGIQQLRLAPTVLNLLGRQFRIKSRKAALAAPYPSGPAASLMQRVLAAPGEVLRKAKAAWRFVPSAMQYNKYLVRLCWTHLALLKSRSVKEFVLTGEGVAADVIQKLSKIMGLHVRTGYLAKNGEWCFRDGDETRDLKSWDGPVLVAELYESDKWDAKFKEQGVDDERIFRLI